MQFVVTTHSPMILAGCARNEVWILRQDATTGDVTAEPAPVAPALLTAAELYRDFFALSRGMSSELGLKLQRYTSIASNPQRSDAEDAELGTLRSELDRHLVDVDYQPVARRNPNCPGTSSPRELAHQRADRGDKLEPLAVDDGVAATGLVIAELDHRSP
jgi:hypothetical protein